MVLAVIAFTLFGVGLGFYATPSTDAALSNLPDDQAGAGAGIYKMASSLGDAFGVAISAAVFTALSSSGSLDALDRGRPHLCRTAGQSRPAPGGNDRARRQSPHDRGSDRIDRPHHPQGRQRRLTPWTRMRSPLVRSE